MKKVLLTCIIIAVFKIMTAQTGWVNTNYTLSPMSEFEKDTIPVIMLAGDTSLYKIAAQYDFLDTTNYITANSYSNIDCFWMKGYSVREKHSTAEGQIDPGICPSCWHDYWLHFLYLDADKKPLSNKYVVWISKEITWLKLK